jgi:hypothetical protein
MPQTQRTQPPLDAALGWSERSFPALPLRSVGPPRCCSCLKRDRRAGKHVRVREANGFVAATPASPSPSVGAGEVMPS